MVELNKKELQELKRCINYMIGNRIQYSIVEMNEKRNELNEEYKRMDYELLEKVMNEIEQME